MRNFLRIQFCFLLIIYFATPLWAQELLPPSKVNEIYLFGQQKDTQKAIELNQQWLDLYRDDPNMERNMEYEYSSVLSPYRVEKDNQSAIQFLLQELKSAKNPKTIYIINENLAQIKVEEKKFDEAVAHWKEARNAMINKPHPYFTTRQALPFLEIARIYHSQGYDDKAIEYYEYYRNSDYGKEQDNGIVEELGNLYKEKGDWQKAKGLYQHYLDTYQSQSWANQEYKKQFLKSLRERLDGFSGSNQDKTREIVQRLKSEDWFERRRAFHDLRSAFNNGKKEDWLLWMNQYSTEDPDPKVKKVFATLRQYLFSPSVLGPDHEAMQEVLTNANRGEEKYKTYNDLLEMIMEDDSLRQIMQRVSFGNSSEFTLGQLCIDKNYHESLSHKYLETAKLILRAKSIDDLSEQFWRGRSVDFLKKAQEILGKCPTVIDFLREIVSFQNQYAGQAALLLYSLGNRNDIPYIIDNIPESAFQRNYMFWSLASSLYRYGTVDIPEILGVDEEPYLDWWNVKIPEGTVKEKLQAWWQQKKDHFSYTQVNRPGKLLRPVAIMMGISQIIPAPELNGLFWLEEGGRDYSANIYYFDFSTEQFTEILHGGYDGGGSYNSSIGWRYSTDAEHHNIGSIGGMIWNAAEHTLEFTIENVGTYGAVFKEGKLSKILPLDKRLTADKTIFQETIENYGDKTFEIRNGDLFLVDEKLGTEKRILDYGYVLSFFLDNSQQKAVIVDRDILGQSLWLVKIDK